MNKAGAKTGHNLHDDFGAEKEVEDMLQRVYAAALYKTYFEKTSEGLNFEKTSTEIWFETMLQSDTKLSFCSDIVVVNGHDQ